MQPILVIFSGMPGTGKSTAAEKLATYLGFSLISLLGIRQDRGYKKYNRKRTHSDMKELFERMCRAMIAKEDVIVDSVFLSNETRSTYYDTAGFLDVKVIVIECICSENLAKRRMLIRPKNCGLIMESRDPRIYDRLQGRKEEIVTEYLPPHVSHIRYDTEKNEITDVRVSDSVRMVIGAIKNCLAG